jgi:hypothetical protein
MKLNKKKTFKLERQIKLEFLLILLLNQTERKKIKK